MCVDFDLSIIEGGHREDMISNWTQSCTWVTGGASRPLPCPQKVGSAYHSHSPSHIQGHSLDRAIRCSDVLDRTCRWPQLAPLYRPLRSRLWGAEINPCCSPPRPAAYVHSLTYYTGATLPLTTNPEWSAPPPLLALRVWAPISISPGKPSQGCKPKVKNTREDGKFELGNVFFLCSKFQDWY